MFRLQYDIVAMLSEALWNLKVARGREGKSTTTSVSTDTVDDIVTMDEVKSCSLSDRCPFES